MVHNDQTRVFVIVVVGLHLPRTFVTVVRSGHLEVVTYPVDVVLQ